MITICTGWTEPPHAPVVLKPEDGGEPGISHGMCAACQAIVLGRHEADVQYRHHRELHERVDRFEQENGR